MSHVAARAELTALLAAFNCRPFVEAKTEEETVLMGFLGLGIGAAGRHIADYAGDAHDGAQP